MTGSPPGLTARLAEARAEWRQKHLCAFQLFPGLLSIGEGGGASVPPPGYRVVDQDNSEPINPPPPDNVMAEDWGEAYFKSTEFKDWWLRTQSNEEWPPKIKIADNKMYFKEMLCVPEEWCIPIVKEFHSTTGHSGVNRTLKELEYRYKFPTEFQVKEAVVKICRNCEVCQVSEPANWSEKLPIEMTPIPERLWASVCLDIFSMPIVTWQGQDFDAFLLCVDRLSGWMLAKPTTKAGLTGKGPHVYFWKAAGMNWAYQAWLPVTKGFNLPAIGGIPCVPDWGSAERFRRRTALKQMAGRKQLAKPS